MNQNVRSSCRAILDSSGEWHDGEYKLSSWISIWNSTHDNDWEQPLYTRSHKWVQLSLLHLYVGPKERISRMQDERVMYLYVESSTYLYVGCWIWLTPLDHLCGTLWTVAISFPARHSTSQENASAPPPHCQETHSKPNGSRLVLS